MVFWDGKDRYDNHLANGTYMYVIKVKEKIENKVHKAKATGFAVKRR